MAQRSPQDRSEHRPPDPAETARAQTPRARGQTAAEACWRRWQAAAARVPRRADTPHRTYTPDPIPAADAADATPLGVDSLMAGFIVWLAPQRLPAGHRRRYHRAAEAFLRWRAETGEGPVEGPVEGPDLDAALRRYLARLRRAGHGDAELAVVCDAAGLLYVYLLTTHPGPPPPSDTSLVTPTVPGPRRATGGIPVIPTRADGPATTSGRA